MRRRHSPLTRIPEHPRGALICTIPSPAALREIANLRADERYRDLADAVCSSVLYELMVQDRIDNPTRMRFYRSAIERFRSRMAPDEIRAIVDAAIVHVQTQRAQATRRSRRIRATR